MRNHLSSGVFSFSFLAYVHTYVYTKSSIFRSDARARADTLDRNARRRVGPMTIKILIV